MSNPKRPKAEPDTGDSGSAAPAWQGELAGEVIVVTRLEVEARPDYEPDAEEQQAELRRWLRIGEKREQGRTWLFDFEVASPQTGRSPYRFLAHLFASIDDGDPEAEPDAVASAIMNRLSPRLYSIAGEQLFAATIRGPWGPLSLPPQGPPAASLARRVNDASVKAAQTIVDLLAEEGPLPKAELARRFGVELDDAIKVARVRGLIEERDGLIQLRASEVIPPG